MSGRVRWYMCPYAVNGRACETQMHMHVHVPVLTMDGYTKRTYVYHRQYSSMMAYFSSICPFYLSLDLSLVSLVWSSSPSSNLYLSIS